MKTVALAVVSALALGAAGTMVLPRGIDALALVAGPRHEQAVVEYRLAGQSPGQYQTEIRAALSARDEDLAQSLVDLASERKIDLPAGLIAQVQRAKADADARGLEDAWEGFVSGHAPNESALAGAVAADLTGFGDLRDLYTQAGNYAANEEVDTFIVGLAAVGIGLTVATVASEGMLFPAKSGVSTLKAAKRAGRLSPALVRHVSVMAADAVDTRAFGAMASSLKGFDLVATRAAAKTLVRPQAIKTLGKLGSELAEIGTRVGYRGTLQTLAAAESAEDVASVSKLSVRFGKATRAVLVMGGMALTFASTVTSATLWLIGMAFWVAALLFTLTRLSFRVGRWLWPAGTPRVQPA